MRDGDRIRNVLPPVDSQLEGSSAWLRASREKALAPDHATDKERTALARAFDIARTTETASAPLADEPRNSHS